MGRLELPRRPVELVPERFELVAGPDLDAMAEVAGADSRRTFLEHPDRRDHSPGEQNARQDRKPQPQHEDDDAPDDRGAEGSVRVGGGPFDEHQPSDGSDRRVGGEDPPASEAVGDHRVGRGARAVGPGAFTWTRVERSRFARITDCPGGRRDGCGNPPRRHIRQAPRFQARQ